MKRTFTARINYWLMRTIYVQLYLSLMSSPILIYWGLPVSIASPLGNILFNPFLVVFLFFSSLLFFTELLHVPNTLCAMLLNYCTQCMDYSSSFGCQEWLVGFAKPFILLLWLIPILTLFVIHYRYNRKSWRGVISLCVLSVAISIALMYTNATKQVQAIPCNNGSLTLICNQSKTMLIDPGYLGSRTASASYVQYTLVPSIIKSAGTLTIDALIILKLTMTTLQAIAAMSQRMTIHTIYVPALKGQLSATESDQWQTFKNSMDASGIMIVPIENPFSILLGNKKFTVTPTAKKIRYHTVFYNAIAVQSLIDGHEYKWCTPPYNMQDGVSHNPKP